MKYWNEVNTYFIAVIFFQVFDSYCLWNILYVYIMTLENTIPFTGHVFRLSL